MFDNLYRDEVVEIVLETPLDEAAEKLVNIAATRMTQGHVDLPSKPDDITFILYRGDEVSET